MGASSREWNALVAEANSIGVPYASNYNTERLKYEISMRRGYLAAVEEENKKIAEAAKIKAEAEKQAALLAEQQRWNSLTQEQQEAETMAKLEAEVRQINARAPSLIEFAPTQNTEIIKSDANTIVRQYAEYAPIERSGVVDPKERYIAKEYVYDPSGILLSGYEQGVRTISNRDTVSQYALYTPVTYTRDNKTLTINYFEKLSKGGSSGGETVKWQNRDVYDLSGVFLYDEKREQQWKNAEQKKADEAKKAAEQAKAAEEARQAALKEEAYAKLVAEQSLSEQQKRIKADIDKDKTKKTIIGPNKELIIIDTITGKETTVPKEIGSGISIGMVDPSKGLTDDNIFVSKEAVSSVTAPIGTIINLSALPTTSESKQAAVSEAKKREEAEANKEAMQKEAFASGLIAVEAFTNPMQSSFDQMVANQTIAKPTSIPETTNIIPQLNLAEVAPMFTAPEKSFTLDLSNVEAKLPQQTATQIQKMLASSPSQTSSFDTLIKLPEQQGEKVSVVPTLIESKQEIRSGLTDVSDAIFQYTPGLNKASELVNTPLIPTSSDTIKIGDKEIKNPSLADVASFVPLGVQTVAGFIGAGVENSRQKEDDLINQMFPKEEQKIVQQVKQTIRSGEDFLGRTVSGGAAMAAPFLVPIVGWASFAAQGVGTKGGVITQPIESVGGNINQVFNAKTLQGKIAGASKASEEILTFVIGGKGIEKIHTKTSPLPGDVNPARNPTRTKWFTYEDTAVPNAVEQGFIMLGKDIKNKIPQAEALELGMIDNRLAASLVKKGKVDVKYVIDDFSGLSDSNVQYAAIPKTAKGGKKALVETAEKQGLLAGGTLTRSAKVEGVENSPVNLLRQGTSDIDIINLPVEVSGKIKVSPKMTPDDFTAAVQMAGQDAITKAGVVDNTMLAKMDKVIDKANLPNFDRTAGLSKDKAIIMESTMEQQIPTLITSPPFSGSLKGTAARAVSEAILVMEGKYPQDVFNLNYEGKASVASKVTPMEYKGVKYDVISPSSKATFSFGEKMTDIDTGFDVFLRSDSIRAAKSAALKAKERMSAEAGVETEIVNLEFGKKGKKVGVLAKEFSESGSVSGEPPAYTYTNFLDEQTSPNAMFATYWHKPGVERTTRVLDEAGKVTEESKAKVTLKKETEGINLFRNVKKETEPGVEPAIGDYSTANKLVEVYWREGRLKVGGRLFQKKNYPTLGGKVTPIQTLRGSYADLLDIASQFGEKARKASQKVLSFPNLIKEKVVAYKNVPIEKKVAIERTWEANTFSKELGVPEGTTYRTTTTPKSGKFTVEKVVEKEGQEPVVTQVIDVLGSQYQMSHRVLRTPNEASIINLPAKPEGKIAHSGDTKLIDMGTKRVPTVPITQVLDSAVFREVISEQKLPKSMDRYDYLLKVAEGAKKNVEKGIVKGRDAKIVMRDANLLTEHVKMKLGEIPNTRKVYFAERLLAKISPVHPTAIRERLFAKEPESGLIGFGKEESKMRALISEGKYTKELTPLEREKANKLEKEIDTQAKEMIALANKRSDLIASTQKTIASTSSLSALTTMKKSAITDLAKPEVVDGYDSLVLATSKTGYPSYKGSPKGGYAYPTYKTDSYYSYSSSAEGASYPMLSASSASYPSISTPPTPSYPTATLPDITPYNPPYTPESPYNPPYTPDTPYIKVPPIKVPPYKPPVKTPNYRWTDVPPPPPSDTPKKKYPFKLKGKKYKKGYTTRVRKKGKWYTISKPVSREEALDIGARAVKTSLASSFEIKESNMAIEEKPSKTGYFPRFASTFRSYEIRKGRKISTPNRYIEKRATRLSTGFERGAIKQAKKASQSFKGGKSKWF